VDTLIRWASRTMNREEFVAYKEHIAKFTESEQGMLAQVLKEGWRSPAGHALEILWKEERDVAWQQSISQAVTKVEKVFDEQQLDAEEAEKLVYKTAERLMVKRGQVPPTYTVVKECLLCGPVPHHPDTAACPWCRFGNLEVVK